MSADENRTGILQAQYKNSIKKELVRKSIHICSALIPSFLTFAYWPVIACLTVVLVFYIASETLRKYGVSVPVVSHITEVASRKRDENKFVLGPVTLVLGIIVTALLGKPEAARIGIYALAFGDGLASLGGKLFGRTVIPFTHGKTIAGITVPMMSSGIISGAVLSWVSIITEMSSGVILYNNRTMTLTIGTYVQINNGVYGVAAVFASVTTILTIICLAVYLRFTKLEDVQV